jgi:hypothetical protein
MKMKSIIMAIVLLFAVIGHAYETDQFTLPPFPLVDVGSDISNYVYNSIHHAVDKANREISKVQAKIIRVENRLKVQGLNKLKKKFLILRLKSLKKKLVNLHSSSWIAKKVFKEVGGGIVLTEKVEGWLGKAIWAKPIIANKYPGREVAYRQKIENSIFKHATWHKAFGLGYRLLFSSTINLFATPIGTDKLGHFFKQGMQYHSIYSYALKRGLPHHEAEQIVVKTLGIFSETFYFGLILAGNYSNADLATNYSGMKFYQNVSNEVPINGVVYPPILLIDSNGKWFYNDALPHRADILIKKYFNERMSEAYNPGRYDFIMKKAVRKNLVERCPEWKKRFPGMTAQSDAARIERLSTWYGEYYGHTSPEIELVTLGNVCFAE